METFRNMLFSRKGIGKSRYDLFALQRWGLFKITSAAITPGIHPHSHKINTIAIEPQPLSKTDKGGKIIASKTRHMFIFIFLIDDISISSSYNEFVTPYQH